MTEKKPLLIVLFTFLLLVAIGAVGAFYWSYTNCKELESTCTKDTVQSNGDTIVTEDGDTAVVAEVSSVTMKKFLQDFKADETNEGSKIELNYFDGGIMKGMTEYRETIADDEVLSSILSGTVELDGTEITFQLGVDGIGWECETVECIEFTNTAGLDFSGVNGTSGCTVALPGEEYASSIFGITDKTICDDEAKLIELFSKLKSL